MLMTRNFIVFKSCASTAHTFCAAIASNATVTVIFRADTEATIRACALPSSPFTTSRSPARHTTLSRSTVTVFLSDDTADTRPPLARPANNSSAISMTLPGCGI